MKVLDVRFVCPKCGADSGDGWGQCGDPEVIPENYVPGCPTPRSPRFSLEAYARYGPLAPVIEGWMFLPLSA